MFRAGGLERQQDLKLATASEKINVTADVSPILSAVSSMVNDETVGAFVSTEIVKELAFALKLPAASENLFDSTLINPSVVLLFVGVNVAV